MRRSRVSPSGSLPKMARRLPRSISRSTPGRSCASRKLVLDETTNLAEYSDDRELGARPRAGAQNVTGLRVITNLQRQFTVCGFEQQLALDGDNVVLEDKWSLGRRRGCEHRQSDNDRCCRPFHDSASSWSSAIPSRSAFRYRDLRSIPKISAARVRLPSQRRSTASMWRLSRFVSVRSSPMPGSDEMACRLPELAARRERIICSSLNDPLSTIARCTTCSSSRTFPGHG